MRHDKTSRGSTSPFGWRVTPPRSAGLRIQHRPIVSHSRRDRRALYGTLLATLVVLVGCVHTQQSGSSPVPVGNSLTAIHQRGVLRVCSTGDYRPFTFHDPATGGWSGIDIDMGGDLAHQLGLSVQVVATTWATMLTI